MLVTGMTSAKMGDHLLQIGCAHGGRLGAVASKVGLSGRAVTFVPDEASAQRARAGAAQAGVLVEVDVASLSQLPTDDGVFDIAIIDDAGGLLAAMRDEDRVGLVREVFRVLKTGARVMVIGAAPREGLGAIFSRQPSGPPFDPQPSLEAGGFKFMRQLGEREGLRFTEGIKPRT